MRRAAIRATWLPQMECDHIFVVGASPIEPPMFIRTYGKRFGETDVMSFNVEDAFSTIGPKVQAGMQYAITKGYDQAIVTDDDTYVQPGRMMRLLPGNPDCMAYVRQFPLYPQGSAYIVGKRVMEIIADSPELKKVAPDDILVGRALNGKVKIIHNGLFWPGPIARPILKRNRYITTHKAPTADHMLELDWKWKVSNV